MDEIFDDFGDLCFSLLMSYVGALEFLIILRHLVHCSGRHNGEDEDETASLQCLKEKLRKELEAAAEAEKQAGGNVMQDGVMYKDGYRIDPRQAEIERLKAEIGNIEARQKKRAEMEAELVRQRKIKEETKKQLERAEAELARQRAKSAEEEKRNQQEKEAVEDAEKLRRLLELEKQREAEQRQKEEEESENLRKILEAEEERKAKQRRLEIEIEEKERKEHEEASEAENLRLLLEAEQQREDEQRQLEEAEQKRLEIKEKAGKEREEAETENLRRLLEAEQQREAEQCEVEELQATEQEGVANQAAEEEELEKSEEGEEDEEHKSSITQTFLDAERLHDSDESQDKHILAQLQFKSESKQKLIEENARRFLEAEEEMAQLQHEMLISAQQTELTAVSDEPIIKRRQQTHNASARSPNVGLTTTVKTQFGQGSNESFTLTSKPLLFPGVSDDASSNEPNSSKQSSFSTQPSEEITTGTEDVTKTTLGLQIPQHERQDPDGEDNTPTLQYDEEYLRSLDGIKHRPLTRENSSGRRRAFKKRRSSGSSNSSRDSRASREEELKMFTSLEEEELNSAHSNNANFTPIKYTSDPTLKVKVHHHRRHKRSPAQDLRTPEDNLHTSLEMLGEESTNPWGEVIPEHYKDTEFWRREKAISIDEEEIELETPITGEESALESATNKPKTSSFEEATHEQNEEAITTLKQQLSKDTEIQVKQAEHADAAIDSDSLESDEKSNLQTSNEIEDNASPARSSVSPRLRRSPRIDEFDQYEERWKDSAEEATNKQNQPKTPTTPNLKIQPPSDNTEWRDEYGLIMQGLSDFYDFTASVNPSRSRDNSRNASPASSQPNTPQPKYVHYNFNAGQEHELQKLHKESSKMFDVYNDTVGDVHAGNFATAATFDVYDDTGNFANVEIVSENITAIVETLHEAQEIRSNPLGSCNENHACVENIKDYIIQTVADDIELHEKRKGEFVPAIRVECSDNEGELETNMNEFVQSLRNERIRSSRSCSRSPLPSKDNLEHSLETRRAKLIKHNDEIFEKLTNKTSDEMSTFVKTLRLSQNRSRSRSPLPTMDNIERSLETRRTKLIQHNDELYEKISEKVESSNLNVQVEKPVDKDSKEDINKLIESLRLDRKRSRSRSPLPTMDNIARSLETRRNKLIEHNDELFKNLAENSEKSVQRSGKDEISKTETELESREEMNKLVESLRLDRKRSRSRSPLPTMENIQSSLDTRRQKLIQQNEQLYEKLMPKVELNLSSPIITVEAVDEISPELFQYSQTEIADKEMSNLVATLRAARGRSRSKSPMPQPPIVSVTESNDYELNIEEHHYRSRTPSRSQSPPMYSSDEQDFHRLLNLESSQNRTLLKKSEAHESILAEKQRHIDKEALSQLKTAQEETELRMLSPTELLRNSNICEDYLEEDGEEENSSLEGTDQLSDLPARERLRKLRCSPTTPDYERTISEEWQDVQRIKNEMLKSGFKRSTYVGESMEFGNDYEQLRRETAEFRRSKSPSPTLSKDDNKLEMSSRQSAAEKRRIQEHILNELISSSANGSKIVENRNGAKPKTEVYDRSFSKEILDTQRIVQEQHISGFKRSTYVGESIDMNTHCNDMRREMATFQRSRSCSRSPVNESVNLELAAIEAEAVKREMQDKILDNLSNVAAISFQDFSRRLNLDFLDDRRASDSALIQKSDLLVQFRDKENDCEFEPEEYHHYRRFSLNQEQPVEEYPDDNYIYVSQVEVQTPNGTRTWLREDFYSEQLENMQMEMELETSDSTLDYVHIPEGYEILHDDDESEGSEDERQTVVEVDDEIDTDICDFNERGPTDESHHEQSECEEAERSMDHYAGRQAADWQEVSHVSNIIRNNEVHNDEEGAIGGTDSDSFVIDQIYDEAIKNRKQSGILREYDSILHEMQKSYERNSLKCAAGADNADTERYAIWAKTRALERAQENGETKKLATVSFIEAERHDTEKRYLGDANLTARQSARLRSRYGYMPVLPTNRVEEVDVDLNYKPKHEYNWRKNFKLDDDVNFDVDDDGEVEQSESRPTTKNDDTIFTHENGEYFEQSNDCYDERKYSLGGESITLFSRSPEKELQSGAATGNDNLTAENSALTELCNGSKEHPKPTVEKPKKKKSKKKTLRNSKEKLERTLSKDEDDSDNQIYSRRSSSIQMDNDSPKKKSRSRRSSRSSVTNEESNLLFSPLNSVDLLNNLDITNLALSAEKNESAKKKIKKRKKVKETFSTAHDIKEEQELPESLPIAAPTVSAVITPESAELNMLATLSPQHSVCVTPASTESEKSAKISAQPEKLKNAMSTPNIENTTTAVKTSSTQESFDIMKDANFYPLF